MSAEKRLVEAEEGEVGGMIAHHQGEAHLQGEAHHREVVLLQDVEVHLRRDLACSWHRGLLEVQVQVVEVAGGNVRSRRRNLGALEAGTEETVPPGVTRLQGGVARLQGEGLPQEEGHLQGEGVLLAGKRGEAMQEVGDVEVEVEALLQDEALHQEGVPLQGVEEVLTMEVEVDLGGLGLQGEVMTGALQEGDRLQGEVPPLAGDLR